MCTFFLESNFCFGILLLCDFLSVKNGIRQTCQLWLFEIRFSLKGEQNLQLQRWMWQLRPDVRLLTFIKSTPRCPNMHFGERRSRRKNTGWSRQAPSHELSSGLPGLSFRRIFFCSSSLPVVLRKVQANWKRGSGFSAVLYAAVHCEINELSLTLEFLQPAFWKGQCCDIATLLICWSESGSIDQIAF